MSELVIPLLLYLFQNHKIRETAYNAAIELMQSNVNFLHEGDFAKLMTGSQRFRTSTRFAADILCRYGLLRSDKKSFYKIWELSLFGLILASNIYKNLSQTISSEFLDTKEKHSDECKTLKLIERYSISSNSIENFWKLIEYVKEERDVLNYDESIKSFFSE